MTSETNINFNVEAQLTQFRIPTELIKKNFKSTQKLIEKQKTSLVHDIRAINSNNKLTREEKVEILDKMIKGFETFNKKLENKIKIDKEFRSRLIYRMQNLNKLNSFITNSSSDSSSKRDIDFSSENLVNWYRDQINLLIIDYLLKSNTSTETNVGLELIEQLSRNSTTVFKKLIDYDLYINFNKIFLSISKEHDLTLLMSWFQENKVFLRKSDSNLEFEINYSKFLNSINLDKISEALKFSKHYLSPYANINNYSTANKCNYEKNIEKLKETGGLILYTSLNGQQQANPNFAEYFKLLSKDRWENLASIFVTDFFKLYGITNNYPLFIYLSAGLSSLKTKSCKCKTNGDIIFNDCVDVQMGDDAFEVWKRINNCPVCSPELFGLSQDLPDAQLITNIDNNPVKLPNGNIFNKEKLIILNSKMGFNENGKIKDPVTGQVFKHSEMIKMYPT